MESFAPYALTGAIIAQDRAAIAWARRLHSRRATSTSTTADRAVVGQQPFGAPAPRAPTTRPAPRSTCCAGPRRARSGDVRPAEGLPLPLHGISTLLRPQWLRCEGGLAAEPRNPVRRAGRDQGGSVRPSAGRYRGRGCGPAWVGGRSPWRFRVAVCSGRPLGFGGEVSCRNLVPQPPCRPVSGPECRWSLVELGHGSHHRRWLLGDLDSPADVLAFARESGRSPIGPRRGCCRRRWCGRTSTRRSRWRRPRCSAAPAMRAGSATPRYRSPGRGRRWWRSSRSRSSRPRSGCPPRPGSVRRARAGAALPAAAAVEAGDLRRPAGVEGAPGRRADHLPTPSPPRRRATSTGTSVRSRTRSGRRRSTGWWRRRSPGSCPRPPRRPAAEPPTGGTSPSSTTRSPSPAPR